MRALARRFALPVAAKPDSQDICFVPDGDYAGVVAKLRPDAIEPGEIVHLDGRVLGRHQRHHPLHGRPAARPQSSGGGEPLYVLRLEPAARRVVVGPRQALGRASLFVRDVNWLEPAAPERAAGQAALDRGARPRRRSGRAASPARPRSCSTSRSWASRPGQACVFYDGARVLGGGWIVREAAQRAA